MIVSLGAISNQSLERSKLYPVSGANWRSIACTASRTNTHCCVFTKTRKYQKNARLRVHRYKQVSQSICIVKSTNKYPKYALHSQISISTAEFLYYTIL